MDIKKEFEACMVEFKKNTPVKYFKDPEFYHEWLAQTYFFVRHSTALLGFSLPYLKNDDLRHHFENHLGEETKHDLVAIRDLQKMGRNIEEFRESTATQAFYQSQYFRIQFEGGTSLLGYILFLEGLAVHAGREIYEEIKMIHKGTNFLRVHAEEDPEHLEAAIKTIMKLGPEEQKLIMKNMHYSEEMYGMIVQTCLHLTSIKKSA